MSDLDQARADLRARQGTGARYDAASAPAEALHMARRGVAYMARLINNLNDAALSEASDRAGWSRRRVIAASALQAREIAQALEDATGQKGDRAPTDLAALDLAETLPPRALRHLVNHADTHLNVVWRDLSDADWDAPVTLSGRTGPARDTALLRAGALWRAALDLRAGARLRDVPKGIGLKSGAAT
ncbi:MAG: maleylpyruvate isomerase [Paracoccus denitrificans]|uniref:Maleylpyruvate isomerase n=1 Tax=Paracoccus denitrificans TaxID=266 RepID=A0A533IB03_PARDE|nr:MAG: maleylpyruvate isomerase [Paracoccus denitrificans]